MLRKLLTFRNVVRFHGGLKTNKDHHFMVPLWDLPIKLNMDKLVVPDVPPCWLFDVGYGCKSCTEKGNPSVCLCAKYENHFKQSLDFYLHHAHNVMEESDRLAKAAQTARLLRLLDEKR